MPTAKLTVVPTPVGNLSDMTSRAITALKEADLIICEDTRETLKLLNHYGIKKTLESYHKFNEASKTLSIVERIKNGAAICLVSDAGTPLVSDPGHIVVKACIEAGVEVEALPGPSSVLPALVVSGFDPGKFYFHGFLEKKESDKKKELLSLRGLGVPVVLFESPHRVKETLLLINETLGETRCAVVKEISKIHEKVFRGTAFEVANIIPEEMLKGEFVIVFLPQKEEKKLPSEDEIKVMLAVMVDGGMSLSDAVKKVSKDSGVAKNVVYKIGNEIKKA